MHRLLLKRAWHVEHMLTQIRQDEIGRDGCHLIQARFPELALDVIFRREAEPTMGLQADIGRLPGGVGCQ